MRARAAAARRSRTGRPFDWRRLLLAQGFILLTFLAWLLLVSWL